MQIFFVDRDPIIAAQSLSIRGKHHASLDALLSLEKHGTFPVDNGWKDPPQALPEDVQHQNVITAYRQYYNKYKTKFATWKEPANPPEWFVQYVGND